MKITIEVCNPTEALDSITALTRLFNLTPTSELAKPKVKAAQKKVTEDMAEKLKETVDATTDAPTHDSVLQLAKEKIGAELVTRTEVKDLVTKTGAKNINGLDDDGLQTVHDFLMTLAV